MQKCCRWKYGRFCFGVGHIILLLIALIAAALAVGAEALGLGESFQTGAIFLIAGVLASMLITILWPNWGGAGAPRLKRIRAHNATGKRIKELKTKKLQEDVEENPAADIPAVPDGRIVEAGPLVGDNYFFARVRQVEVSMLIGEDVTLRSFVTPLLAPPVEGPPLPPDHYVHEIFTSVIETGPRQYRAFVWLTYGLDEAELQMTVEPYIYDF